MSTPLIAQDILIQQKTASVTEVPTGQYFTYVINFACDNTTDQTPCQNVVITDVLPLGVELNGPDAVSAFSITNPGTQLTVVNYQQGGAPDFSELAELSLNLGDIAPGDAGVLIINARYQGYGAIPDGYTTTNTATITSDNDVLTTNNSGSVDVEATASSPWEVRKVVEPGSVNANTSETEAALDNPVFYTLGFDGGSNSRQGAAYYGVQENSGGLALYNPFIVDILEVGLACDDIDTDLTTSGFVCLAPGETDANTGYINTSLTQFAVVWDLDDDAIDICGTGPGNNGGTSDPLVVNNPCPGAFRCPEFADSEEWRNGIVNFSQCAITLAVIYRISDGFSANDMPVNQVELWGQNPEGPNLAEPGANALQDQDIRPVTLIPAGPAGVFDKEVLSFARSDDDSTFVGDFARWSIILTNTGNIALTNVSLIDTLAVEDSVDGLGVFFTGYSSTYGFTLYYSDGSSETIDGLSGDINANSPNSTGQDGLDPINDFTVPPGGHVDSILLVLDDPLLPGQRVLWQINTLIEPTRNGDDMNTASYDNPMLDPDPDAGLQLAGSMVEFNEFVTNCAGFRSDQISGSDCDELPITIPAILTQPTKLLSPSTPSVNGDVITFGLNPNITFGSVNATSLTLQDTLPAFLEFVPGSVRLADFTQNPLEDTDAAFNRNNIVITGSNVFPHPTDPTRQIVEITISGTSGELDIINWVQFVGNRATPAFDVVIGEDHLAGTFTNDFCFSAYEDAGTPANWFGRFGTAAPGPQLFFDNSPGTARKASTTYQVIALPSGEARKLSDADITPSVSVSPGVQRGTPGSTATFTLIFENAGNEELINLSIVDLLPLPGDVGPTTLTPRGSDFEPIFLGNFQSNLLSDGVPTPVTPDIFYSTSINPCRSEYILGMAPPFPAGCVDDFTLIPPADLADTRAFGLQFGSLAIPPGDSIVVTFDVQFPTPDPIGIAWNSFSWIGEGDVSGVSVGAEAPRVGITTEELPMSLGSTVFNDLNNNGLLDGMEMGISGVMVELLFDANGDGVIDGDETTPLAVATTDPDGNYFFGELQPGRYLVQIPATEFAVGAVLEDATSSVDAATSSMDNQVDNDDNGLQSGGASTTVTSPFIFLDLGLEPTDGTGANDESGSGSTQDNLVVDENGDMTVDFGFFTPIEPVAVGDTVFFDMNANGLQDAGDTGVEGVTVTLFTADGIEVTLDASGEPVMPATTDPNGFYEFINLPPGDYFVVFDIATAAGGDFYDFTGQNAGGDEANDSDADPDTGQSDNTGVLEPGENFSDLDAGVICNVSAEAGTGRTICSTASIDLTSIGATFTPIGVMAADAPPFGATWTSSGDGTFDGAGRFGTATTYTLGANDIAAGSVVLTLRTDDPTLAPFDAINCGAIEDQVTFIILKVDCGQFLWGGN